MAINLILEKSKYVKGHTYIRELFENIIEFQNIKWLIAGVETNTSIPGLDLDEEIVINGYELLNIVNKMEFEPQWIWAVFSGFHLNQKIPDHASPNADGDSRYWKNDVYPEIKEAIMEIVCWDSSATLFIGIDENIAGKLTKMYPDIKDLTLLNRKSAQQGDAPEPATDAYPASQQSIPPVR